MSSSCTVAVTPGHTLIERVRSCLSPAAAHSWFGHVTVNRIDTEQVEIAVPSLFVKSWIERNYLQTLRDTAAEIVGGAPAIVVTLQPNPDVSAPADSATPLAASEATRVPQATASSTPPSAQSVSSAQAVPIRGYARFESFLVADSNRLAHAACSDIARKPGSFPLVILHGGHGCGKTHLLQAAVAASLEAGHRAVFLPAGQLVQELQKAFRTGHVEAWRARMSGYDLLAIDDLPTLSDGNKTATQKELTHLLDTTRLRGSTILFAQTGAPGDGGGFAPMLASRLSGGLSLPLHSPEASLRGRILHALATTRHIEIPEEAVAFLLQATGENLRELEGAVQTLAALVTFGGVSLTLERVRQAIRPFAPSSIHEINPGTVAELVAETFHVPVGDLLGKRRTARIARLRRLALHLVRRFSTASLTEIGAHFGGRTHATILSALKNPALSTTDTDVDRNRIRGILCQLGCQEDPEAVFLVQDNLFE